jgi:hypothetical protein
METDRPAEYKRRIKFSGFFVEAARKSPARPYGPANQGQNCRQNRRLSFFGTVWRQKLMQKIHRLTDN